MYLAINPILVCANSAPTVKVTNTQPHNYLLILDQLNNNLMDLIEEELAHINFTIRRETLVKIECFEEFSKERDRLLVSFEENRTLYLSLVHIRICHDNNWPSKFSISYSKP